MILYCIELLCKGKKDITSAHVDEVMRLASLQVGKENHLPYGIVVRKSYQGLIFERREEKEPVYYEEKPDEESLLKGITIVLPDGKSMYLHLRDYEKNAIIPTKTYTKWLDYDKIKEPLAVRNPKDGDFFYFNDKNKKYVKEYMVNEKIPATERGKSIILAEGNRMIYFVGKRISHHVKIDDSTKRILEIVVTGG